MSENNLHNLLGQHDRRTLAVAYYTRVAGVAGILFGGVAVIGLVMLFPAYLSLTHEISTTHNELASFAESDRSYRDDLATIKGSRLLTERVSTYLARDRGTFYLDRVLAADTGAITIDSYSFDRRARTMVVGGVAATRGDLVSFSDLLAADSVFEHARVPVENFENRVDLPFTMTLTIASSSTKEL